MKKFTVTNYKNPGTVKAEAVRGTGTLMVLIEYAIGVTIGPDTKWTTCPGSKNSCVISGLTSAETIWVRATSVGRRGQILYATPVKTVIL